MPGTTLSVDPLKTAAILEAAAPLEWTDFGRAGCESESDGSATEELEARIELGRTDIETDDVELKSVRVLDMEGRVHGEFPARDTSAISLDLSYLSQGIYFLEIRTKEGFITKKIVKSK